MHACLNVDEIVRLITCELVASEGRATALALACCCKRFEDPVLDALWATQIKLRLLLKTFPEDISVWNGGKFDSFRRLPTTTEWARFRKYARRMRIIIDECGVPGIVSSEVFSVMQHHNINEPLLPSLKTLALWEIYRSFIPFIPLFLSPTVTSVSLVFGPNPPKVIVASTVSTFPKLCPNLQMIRLFSLPRDPMITAAVSGMLLAANPNTFQQLFIDSPLTEEASEVVCNLPNLSRLSVVVERETSLSSALLPNLTELAITCDGESGWPRLFHGATLEKLESVNFCRRYEQGGDFLRTFERAAISSSVQNTLSRFHLFTSCSWNPNYSSLLPFTQLVQLEVESSCSGGCSSRVDDEIVINLSRAMPGLKTLRLGSTPCRRFTTGVTAKGLVALARHCPNLTILRVHFQVASLSNPPAHLGMDPASRATALRINCALKVLEAGNILVPEESAMTVALTLLSIFPQIETFNSADEWWWKVENAIRLSRQVIDFSCATLETGS